MNRIHPSAVIGPEVQLGDDNVVGPGVVLAGPCIIGDDNWIGPYAVIGTPAEIRGTPHPAVWDEPGDHEGLVIGNGNVLREHVCIHAPHYGRTRVGDDCYIMNNCYVGHDGHIGDSVTMASTVVLGGHCRVDDGANLGLSTSLHQRTVVGAAAMVGMGSVLTHDVPPFAKAFGNPCRVRGANTVGMARLGIEHEVAAALDRAYRDWNGSPHVLPEVPPVLEPAFDWYRTAIASTT